MSRILFVLALAFAMGLALPLAASANSARSFTFTVSTEVMRVEPPTGHKSYESILCWQNGATPVYLGGKDVSPRNGYPICTDTPQRGLSQKADAGPICQSDSIQLDVSNLYAVVAGLPGAPGSPSSQSLLCIIAQ